MPRDVPELTAPAEAKTAEQLRAGERPSFEQLVLGVMQYAVDLHDHGLFETAITVAKRGLSMDPTNAGLWSALGSAYMNLGRLAEGEEPLRKAAALRGDQDSMDLANLGQMQKMLHRDFDAAERMYAKALKCASNGVKALKDPTAETLKAAKEDAEKRRLGAIFDRATVRLDRGNWKRGLVDYEARIELKGAPLYPKFPIPMWKGEPLDGKVLYVQKEQGMGDQILFSRYFKLIKDRWPTCKIYAGFEERFWNLFLEFRGIVEFLPRGTTWDLPEHGADMTRFDFGVYQASLPLLFGTTPETVPPDSGLILRRARRQQALGTFPMPQTFTRSLKVGIAWTGNPDQSRNNFRSIPFKQMMSLGESDRVTLFSFQVFNDEITANGAQGLICDLGPDLEREGLVGAAEAMLSMDLIITVCTGTAHLAGALGVPCWTLLCWDPYWIWLTGAGGDARERSVWYPSVRLFRQKVPLVWDDVLDRVKDELAALPLPG